MRYGHDYDRNFLERAADTVRGWFGGREYDHDFHPRGPGWRGDSGYRELGHPGRGRVPRGYDRELHSGWRGDAYRTHRGYHPSHGGWDVDWEHRGMSRGGYGRDFDRGYRVDRHAWDEPRGRMMRGRGPEWSRGRGAGVGRGWADGLGDMERGTAGNWGDYRGHGMDNLRGANQGGVQPGAHYRGYGIGSHRV